MRPFFTFFKGLECFQKFFVLVGYHRAHYVAGIPYTAHLHAGGAIDEFMPEFGVVVHRTFYKQQRACRALLSGIAEGRSTDVHDGVVAVARCGEDYYVLAAWFWHDFCPFRLPRYSAFQHALPMVSASLLVAVFAYSSSRPTPARSRFGASTSIGTSCSCGIVGG